MLLLEAMRESLCLLLRTGRWIRYWRLINAGILSLQIPPEVPTFYFLLAETKPGNAHGSAYTYICLHVCMTGEKGVQSCRLALWKTCPHCHLSPGQHSHIAALTGVKVAFGWGADAGSLDGDTHSARWWPILRYELLGYMAQRWAAFPAGHGRQELSDTLGSCVWKGEHTHTGSLS